MAVDVCMCVCFLQAAAALCIGSGSFADPPDIPGLSHFLEHSKLFYANLYNHCYFF